MNSEWFMLYAPAHPRLRRPAPRLRMSQLSTPIDSGWLRSESPAGLRRITQLVEHAVQLRPVPASPGCGLLEQRPAACRPECPRLEGIVLLVAFGHPGVAEQHAAAGWCRGFLKRPVMQACPPVPRPLLHNSLAKPPSMARGFCKGPSLPARPAGADSSRLLANLVSQAEQRPVQPQPACLVQLHHLPQQSSW
jgi:hypothetical protein